MSKEKTEISPVRASRLKELISESGLTQKDFAQKVDISLTVINGIVNNKKPLTEPMATRIIIGFFPDYNLSWLLGYDTEKKYDDLNKKLSDDKEHENAAIDFIIRRALNLAIGNNGLNISFDDIAPKKIELLKSQLLDYAQWISSSMIDYTYIGHYDNYSYHKILDNKKGAES